MALKDITSTTGVLASSGEHGAVSVQIGDVLVGKYKVEAILGQGGMGVVVSALHLHLQERVALKFLRPGAGRTEEFNARFLREAQVTAKLRNEHIVKVSDVGVLESGAPYMVMEYVSGTDLRRVMRTEGPLPVPQAIDYIIQACEGLAEAHAIGVVHRDLKPSNLFITHRRDGSDLIKVLDFGISKANLMLAEELEDLTAAGALLGSPKYMSPEQLTNTAQVDERSDVWSLGVVLYEMLTGAPPFVAETHAATCVRVLGQEPPASIVARRKDVPPELEQAIFHALERDMSLRTANVADFAEEVGAAARDVLPPAIGVAIERIRGTIDARSKGTASTPPSRTASILTQTMSHSYGSLSSRRSAGGAVVSTRQDAPRRTGLLIAAGLVIVVLLGVVAVFALRQPDKGADAALAAGTAGTPSAPLVQPNLSPPTATTPSTSGSDAAAARPTEFQPPASAATQTTGRPPRTHGQPPAPKTTAPPTTTPTTTATKKVDPLEERQ